ncbi:hypothetical protein D0Z07_6527 [Hyphodiscus hymeniophilus]|uniref:Uncharacterized protein n=1 Tax=Hyphodiscus hymeniophilus TaxID=353542 RepID=A0A9P6VGJ8_9HELO|nr:hypothetical protein D0Z07_6527 [Hyphodiscus hymeniophilus]
MSATSTPGSAPKSMSSRLLTMKFMQRAAASPTPSPSTPDEPSPKRRKKDTDSPGAPAFDVNALVNQRAIEAAAVEEDAKRQNALEKAAAESGDTRWVLSFEDQTVTAPNLPLRIVQTGYANLDVSSSFRPAEEFGEDKPVMVGRRSFGKFNKKVEKHDDEDDTDSSSDEEDEEDSEDDSDSDDPASEMIKTSRREAVERVKAEQKAKKRAEKAKAKQLAKDRKKKNVNLNSLTSISGSQFVGTPAKPATPGRTNVSCYICGGPHFKAECPQREKKRIYPGGGDDGPSRKFIKTR